MAQEFIYNDKLDEVKRLADAAAMEGEKEKDVDKYFLDFSTPSPRPTPVIYDPTNPNRLIVSECNIFAIIGEAKSYKSFLASLLCIDFFNQHKDRDCILIDTEQAEWNVKNVARRVCDGLGWDYKEAYSRGRLKIANLRPYSKAERLQAVEGIITKYKPYLCIVDGIRDLITSVNDDIESSNIVDKFMAWSSEYQCAIGTILHTNKDGETARGHTGFELLAKCETVLLTKKNSNGGATVKALYSRNPAIESFNFIIGEDYVPKRVKLTEDDMSFSSIKENAAFKALKPKRDVAKQEWLYDIRISSTPMLAQQTAEKYFADFVSLGILIPTNREATFFSHKDSGAVPLTPQPDTQQDLSFNALNDSSSDPF